MTQLINGPGVGLPIPQNLYPSELINAPYDTPTNRIGLAPGDTLPIPAGHWFVTLNSYCVLQWLDPVNNTWSTGPTPGWTGGQHFVISDGFNVRVANLLGCPLSASVAVAGSNYVQASTTVTAVGATAGALSTWQPIIGGQLTSTIISAGKGYGIAPEVFIPAPPPPANNANGVGGIAAHGYTNITNGTLTLASGFSFTNPGAGYPSAFTVTALPSPNDPNIATGITAATIVFSVTASGSITGALCTNNGAPLTTVANITLSIAGAGSSGSLTANVLQTITSCTVSGSGGGYGTTGLGVQTTGGVPATGSISNNPDALYLAFRPRQPNISLPSVTSGGVGTIYDGGLFMGLPSALIVGGAPSTVGTLAIVMGSRADYVTLQPAP